MKKIAQNSMPMPAETPSEARPALERSVDSFTSRELGMLNLPKVTLGTLILVRISKIHLKIRIMLQPKTDLRY